MTKGRKPVRNYQMKVGDMVRLNSGGPRMKVQDIYGADHYHAGKVNCAWTDLVDEKPAHCTEVFEHKSLHVVETRDNATDPEWFSKYVSSVVDVLEQTIADGPTLRDIDEFIGAANSLLEKRGLRKMAAST